MADETVRTEIMKALQTHGTSAVSKRLGMSPEACLRVAAGLPVRPGTLALARQGIAAMASSPQFGEAPQR
jgi:hypothetical protein